MSQEILAAFVHEFGFDAPSVEDMGVGQGQTRRLKVSSGGHRFMAKHYADSSEATRKNLTFECEMLRCLDESGASVARHIETRDGEPFALVEGRPLLVYGWADGGVEWPATSPRAAALGRSLAELHLATDAMGDTEVERVYDVDRLIDRPLSLLEPFAEDRTEFDRLVELCAAFKSQIEKIPVGAPCFGPIHGDIHQGNCHFGDGDRLTIFDFALCGVGYRVYDLTGFLWPMRDRTIEDKAMRDCCEAFLAGYQSIRPLHPAEKDCIPVFVQVRTLWESADWVDSGTGRDQPWEVAKVIPYMVRQFSGAQK